MKDKYLLVGYGFAALLMVIAGEWAMFGALLIGLSIGAIIGRHLPR